MASEHGQGAFVLIALCRYIDVHAMLTSSGTTCSTGKTVMVSSVEIESSSQRSVSAMSCEDSSSACFRLLMMPCASTVAYQHQHRDKP